MAEIGYGIAVKVLEQLGFLTYQELSSAWGVQSDLEKLKDTVSAIKAVLLDAEEKQASDHRLNHWLGKLRDVLHDADNVLDEFNYRVLQKEVMKKYGSTSKKVRDLFSSSNPLASRFKLAHKIKNIRKRVDDIAVLKDQFNLAQGLEDRKITMHMRDMTHSFFNPSDVIGRDDDKKKIIDLLMQQDAGRNVSVIPIIGIGGLGKTTIAKLVYRDEGVGSHFQLRMWVCVSDEFDVAKLMTEILKSAKVTIDDKMSVDALQEKLRDCLKNKTFLLVLDDVWNEDRNKWIELEALLRGAGGCNGSKIIVTTRNDSVANIMGTTPTYKLDGLSQEECLSLFVKLAFKEGEQRQHPNLLKIGEEIVRKCKGVPLAVRTLAGLLYSKVDEKEWKFVKDNEIWKLEQTKGGILPALRFSYDQLPFQLKQCFAYCSLFPKDYEFSNVNLIQHWMAYGILQSPVNENQELEDIGDLYIKELLSRSFFQDVEEEEILPIYHFKMHDLVHDLALSIAKDECSLVTKQSSVAAEVCHLSILDNGQEVTTQLEKLSKIQTVIFQTEQPVSLAEACISRFKYLRVLGLKNSSFEELPSSIGTLIHLRFLNLSGNDKIKQLPNSICKLHNLQTLWLDGCKNLERLPKGIRNMISLRSLTVTTEHTSLLENGEGCLNSLRYLAIAECKHLKCLFEGMDGRLPYLRTLVVRNCPSLTSLSLSIKHLIALEVLWIQNCEELSFIEEEDNENLKLSFIEEEDNENLKLSLRTLKIVNLPRLEVLPQRLKGSANTLQHLEIVACHNFKTLPEWLPHLKSLQKLRIYVCPKLSSLPKGMQALTALRDLRIQDCKELSLTEEEENQDLKLSLHILKIVNLPKLEVLPQGLQGSANTLQHLEIEACHNFKTLPEWLPHLKSLQKLQIYVCPKLSSLPKGMQALTNLEVLPQWLKGSANTLRRLVIESCHNFKTLPEWLPRLKSLQKLGIYDCPKLSSLPKGMQALTALRDLSIYGCEELSLTVEEENQDLKLSLRMLDIKKLPKLEVLPQWLKGGSANTLQDLEIESCHNFKTLPEWLPSLKSLQKLRISDCPKLSSLPEGMQALTALGELEIHDCEELSLTEEEENQDLKLSLRKLDIRKLPKLEVLPQGLQGSANTLQHLEIEKCHNFKTLPEWLPHLKSLQYLSIYDCPKLSSLPKGMQALTALRNLTIIGCEELSLTEEEENQDLKLSLRSLSILRLPKLEVLPQWLKGSATLQFLQIRTCDNFKTLPEWLPSLKSLQELWIIACPKCSSLPEGMQALTALRELKILDCPKLSRRCRKEDGPKIAHVPDVKLDEDYGSSS